MSRQRAIMSAGDWVSDGRHICSVVAPQAEVKVFLTASVDERARRRHVMGGSRVRTEGDDGIEREAVGAQFQRALEVRRHERVVHDHADALRLRQLHDRRDVRELHERVRGRLDEDHARLRRAGRGDRHDCAHRSHRRLPSVPVEHHHHRLYL